MIWLSVNLIEQKPLANWHTFKIKINWIMVLNREKIFVI